MLIDFEIRSDIDDMSALLAFLVEITNPNLETLDYEYKSIYDMTNDVVVFEHELTIEELDAVDAEIIKQLGGGGGFEMNIDEVVIGMEVKGSNMFGLKYTVVGVESNKVVVEHRTGEKVMYGGKWIPEVFKYKVSAKSLNACENK